MNSTPKSTAITAAARSRCLAFTAAPCASHLRCYRYAGTERQTIANEHTAIAAASPTRLIAIARWFPMYGPIKAWHGFA